MSTELGWPKAVVIMAMMAFAAFVLWMTANHFDASELKALGGLTIGAVGREFLPAMARFLAPTTELLTRGQVE